MTESPTLAVHAVSQRFARSMRHALRYGLADIVRGARAPSSDVALRAGEFWALRDVSFALRAGESVGILGRNGAGKSTMLKLIAGIYAPTVGRITLRGRVSAIIELGAAFAPNLTGRENIRPQALLNGFDERRIRATLDEIIAFADLGDFIDAPVQHYSTGMRARLGFAIAAHAASGLLLIDEVLAVGDLAFQNKCLKFVERYRHDGGTVLFVGHSTHQMQAACDRGIILDTGRIVFDGPMVDALDSYMRVASGASQAGSAAQATMASVSRERAPSTFHVGGVSLETNGRCLPDLLLDVRLDAARDAVRFAAAVFSEDGAPVAGAVADPLRLAAGRHCVRVRFAPLSLLPGGYLVRLSAIDGTNAYPVWTRGWEDAPVALRVDGRATAAGNLFASVGINVRLDATAERLEARE